MSYNKKEAFLGILLFLVFAVFYIVLLPVLSSYLWFKIAVIIGLIVLAIYSLVNYGFVGLVFVAVCLLLAWLL